MTITLNAATRAEASDYDKVRLSWASDTANVARVDLHNSSVSPITIASWSRFGQVLNGTDRFYVHDAFADNRYIIAIEYNASSVEVARSAEMFIGSVAGLPVYSGDPPPPDPILGGMIVNVTTGEPFPVSIRIAGVWT